MKKKQKTVREPVGQEYPCTECAGDATVGFSNWRGSTGQIIGRKERLCSACARKRHVTFSFHATPNTGYEPTRQKALNENQT